MTSMLTEQTHTNKTGLKITVTSQLNIIIKNHFCKHVDIRKYIF